MRQEEVWDSIAEEWSKFRFRMNGDVRDFLGKCKGKILDVGCGSGRNFMKIRGLKIYGIDFSKNMISLAEKRANKEGIDVGLRVSNTTNLPYQNSFFDSVLCYAVLHCIESKNEREATIKELYRVLKTGGIAFFSVWGKNSERIKNKENEVSIPWTINGKKFERYTYIFKEKELKEMLEDAGFIIEKFWEDENLNFIVRK